MSHVSPTIKDIIKHFVHEHDVIMFTICMDVIDSAFAPGVSAPAVRFVSTLLLELAKRILPSDKVS
ncbi:arginase family protein [Staphylococcus aureus]